MEYLIPNKLAKQERDSKPKNKLRCLSKNMKQKQHRTVRKVLNKQIRLKEL